ncbi:MAG: protein-disulfide reductase DsbD [Ramlibacter sp.]
MKHTCTLEPRRLAQFRTLAILLLWLLSFWPVHAEETFFAPEQAFQLTVGEPADGKVHLHWTLAPGYYLYHDRMAVARDGGIPVTVNWPKGESKADLNFGMTEVYHREVNVDVDAGTAEALQLTWQGCAEQGLCYPPQKKTVALQRMSNSAAEPPPGAAAPGAISGAWGETGISQLWAERSPWWTVPLAFLLGIGLAFTPCVLPMVPILSGIVVGQQASTRRALLLSVAFVLPMGLIYAGLGMLAAVAGAGLQAMLQNTWTLLGFSLLFVALAFSMFGFYELQLPASIRDRLAGVGAQGGSVTGAAVLGALSALLVGPCMTAPLAGTLLYIAQSGKVVQGALLLLALGLGMGVPLIVISTLGARFLPKPGPWMNRVKGAFGFIMLGTAAWMAQRVLPAPTGLLIWGALLSSAAVTVWHLSEPRPHSGGTALFLRSAALLAGLWGTAMVLGSASGASDPVLPLAQLRQRSTATPPAPARDFELVRDPAVLQVRLDAARAQGKPALVDFSADWCTACKSLERDVFGNPEVMRSLDGVVLLRADVTASDAAQQALMRRYQVMGPPTVLLFDAHGAERRSDRLVGEFDPGDLLKRVHGLGVAS